MLNRPLFSVERISLNCFKTHAELQRQNSIISKAISLKKSGVRMRGPRKFATRLWLAQSILLFL